MVPIMLTVVVHFGRHDGEVVSRCFELIIYDGKDFYSSCRCQPLCWCEDDPSAPHKGLLFTGRQVDPSPVLELYQISENDPAQTA